MTLDFPPAKEARLIELGKRMREEGLSYWQISQRFGVPEEWFIQKLDEPKKKPPTKRTTRRR